MSMYYPDKIVGGLQPPLPPLCLPPLMLCIRNPELPVKDSIPTRASILHSGPTP